MKQESRPCVIGQTARRDRPDKPRGSQARRSGPIARLTGDGLGRCGQGSFVLAQIFLVKKCTTGNQPKTAQTPPTDFKSARSASVAAKTAVAITEEIQKNAQKQAWARGVLLWYTYVLSHSGSGAGGLQDISDRFDDVEISSIRAIIPRAE